MSIETNEVVDKSTDASKVNVLQNASENDANISLVESSIISARNKAPEHKKAIFDDAVYFLKVGNIKKQQEMQNQTGEVKGLTETIRNNKLNYIATAGGIDKEALEKYATTFYMGAEKVVILPVKVGDITKLTFIRESDGSGPTLPPEGINITNDEGITFVLNGSQFLFDVKNGTVKYEKQVGMPKKGNQDKLSDFASNIRDYTLSKFGYKNIDPTKRQYDKMSGFLTNKDKDWIDARIKEVKEQIKSVGDDIRMLDYLTLQLGLLEDRNMIIEKKTQNTSQTDLVQEQAEKEKGPIQVGDLIFINKENTKQISYQGAIGEAGLEMQDMGGSEGYTHVGVITNTNPLEFADASMSAEGTNKPGFSIRNFENYAKKYDFRMMTARPKGNGDERASKAKSLVQEFQEKGVGGYDKSAVFTEKMGGLGNFVEKFTGNDADKKFNCAEFASYCLGNENGTSIPNKLLENRDQIVPTYGTVIDKNS